MRERKRDGVREERDSEEKRIQESEREKENRFCEKRKSEKYPGEGQEILR